MLVLIGVAILTGFGLLALKQIPIDAFPDVTNVQVQVFATAGAMSPPEVEKVVIWPIEIQMGGLPRLEEIRSVSIGCGAVLIIAGIILCAAGVRVRCPLNGNGNSASGDYLTKEVRNYAGRRCDL